MSRPTSGSRQENFIADYVGLTRVLNGTDRYSRDPGRYAVGVDYTR